MVIDTSAIIAILLGEPEATNFIELINNDPIRLMSAVSAVEASIVMMNRKGRRGLEELKNMIDEAEIKIVEFNKEQYRYATDAMWNYGKGRHPAGLNFDDCFTYALAKSTQQPVLFKGNDFSQTDVANKTKYFSNTKIEITVDS